MTCGSARNRRCATCSPSNIVLPRRSTRTVRRQLDPSAATQAMNDTGTTNQRQPVKLIEGEDYYLEGGLLVFTATYHLKRGYCCESGCRHCPYPTEARETPGR